MARAIHRKSRGLAVVLGVCGVLMCSLAVAFCCMNLSFATADYASSSIATFGISRTSAPLPGAAADAADAASTSATLDPALATLPADAPSASVAAAANETADAAATASTEFINDADDAADAPLLQGSAQRDITQGINEIIAEEQSAERQAIARADEHRSAYLARFGSLPLEDVDWSIGEEAFIATWTERINDYLAGFPLAGHGEDFARAAWEYGVDPRWSPAISNTESTRGSVCFLPHNAWGWGASAWDSWSQAIDAHVSGLAKGYGYTIAYSYAQKYCPPNYDNWYRDTLGQMARI